MTEVAWELVVILLLVVVNGVFAMSEISVVSSRRGLLQQRADAGDRGARTALDLAESPERFLATIQIGITLIGILAGAFGGATLAEEIATWIAAVPAVATYAEAIAVSVVVLAITFLSLVVGELAPKRIGLARAESIAAFIARPMDALSHLMAPLVSLLGTATSLVLRFLPFVSDSDRAVTEEEVRLMIRQGAQEGVFSPGEQVMIDRVLQLNDRTVDALMTPRRDVVWIDVDEPVHAAAAKVAAGRHSHVPVARGDLDEVAGVVSAQDLLASALSGAPVALTDLMRPALCVPEAMTAAALLQRFREERDHVAIVIDEFGGCEGLVTVDDVLGAIVGDLPTSTSEEQAQAVVRADGSWLVDGRLRIDRLREIPGIADLPPGAGDEYLTVGGLVMTLAGRLPEVGDHYDWQEWTYEVVDMDHRRVDKVLIDRRRERAVSPDDG